MSEDSPAVRRAKKREKASLDRAARALGYYRQAVAYRKLIEMRENWKRSNAEIAERTQALIDANKNTAQVVKDLEEKFPLL
jgi:hypothetical protein